MISTSRNFFSPLGLTFKPPLLAVVIDLSIHITLPVCLNKCVGQSPGNIGILRVDGIEAKRCLSDCGCKTSRENLFLSPTQYYLGLK